MKLLLKLFRKRIIIDRTNEPYLERYMLFSRKQADWLPFNVLVHKFCKSDPGDMHDHPWNWISLVLSGGYWEYTPKGCFWRSPLSIRSGKAEDLHRIELDENSGEVWTLFITFKRRREWGFTMPNGEWIQWEKYLDRLSIPRS